MADSATATRQRHALTPEHKEALARGRRHGKAVKAYLEALDGNRPRRGRKVSKEQLQERLVGVNQRLEGGELDPVSRVKLIQEKLDLETRLTASEGQEDLEELEQEFIRSAKPWADSQGVTYAAFRQAGVPVPVLKAAGLPKAS